MSDAIVRLVMLGTQIVGAALMLCLYVKVSGLWWQHQWWRHRAKRMRDEAQQDKARHSIEVEY